MPLHPIRVTDLNDARIEVFRNVRDRDLLGRRRSFIAESEMVLRRLLATPDRLHAILLSPHRLRDLRPELERLPAHVEVYEADIELLTKIVGFFVHRGVLAAGRRPDPNELTIESAFGHLRDCESCTLLAAEGMTNVDNMGALFRNAAVFGADGIILDPTCCDPLYRKSIRVSMGHVFSVPYALGSRWPDDLVRLRSEWGMTVVAAEMTSAARPLAHLPRARRMTIVFGSEGTGLSVKTLSSCEAVFRIPTRNDSSLNVAVSSAVFLYERSRVLPDAGVIRPGDA